MCDHLGTPLEMHDGQGQLSWAMELDSYGAVRKQRGEAEACPFRYQGQYEDQETGLYYNRFRYYDPHAGQYVSQDPIGLSGGNPNIYAYVHDPNVWVDIFGLDVIRLRHYTSRKGFDGIQESMRINPGDQNAVFAVKAKGKPLSMSDAAEKFKVKPNHTRDYIDFNIDDSRAEFRTNDLGVEEYKIKGGVDLDPETTKFQRRCQ